MKGHQVKDVAKAWRKLISSQGKSNDKDMKKLTTKIPEKGDRGKVLGVADDEVNMIRPTEDLVSGKDIRADADSGGRRTGSRRETGALPNVATSSISKDRRRSTEQATSSSRKVGDSPEKGRSSFGDAQKNR